MITLQPVIEKLAAIVEKLAAIWRAVLGITLRGRRVGPFIVGAAFVLGFSIFAVFIHYSLLINERIRAAPEAGHSLIFAAPRAVRAGERTPWSEVAAYLERAGYGRTPGAPAGWYAMAGDTLQIHPGADSPFSGQPAALRFSRGRVARIINLQTGSLAARYLLEPLVVSNLTGANREKRRPIRFQQIPKSLLGAVLAGEDKRFFRHGGFDLLRTLKAAWVDVRAGRKQQGASTISMQLARTMWLDREKTFRRKALETFMAFQLERRFSKEQIFEMYANQIYLGRRGTYNIRGLGEAARVYFGKDVEDLTVAESALLAGMIQAPSSLNPYRWPERARARRSQVLAAMRENGYISAEEREAADRAPLALAPLQATESTEAPYFVDLVNQEVQSRLPPKQREDDLALHAYRISTSLDLDLQRAAVEAVRAGIQEVDKQVRQPRRRGERGAPEALPQALPQVALVALDPSTGAVKALIGGRDYTASQLNRALARRQPGSVFKPFVYAAALSSPLNGGPVLTTASMIADTPTTFVFGDERYAPTNFGDAFYGMVGLRTAFTRSLNVPAVLIAERTGYKNVAELARRAGMNGDVRGTPAVALGAYDTTPLELAGAYTIFSNQGEALKPLWITSVTDRSGRLVWAAQSKATPVLDRRVAYLVVNLMEEVLQSGTGAGVRARGFAAPAAGKTGTSRDGWFAGFTSKLLCVVWVGYDDGRELNLEGSKAALPIWTEFMKRAQQLPEYSDPRPFEAPPGIVRANIDPTTGKLAAAYCPTRTELFLPSTQPQEVCDELHDVAFLEKKKNIFQRLWNVFR